MTAVDLDALDKLRGALAAALGDLEVSPVSLYAAVSRLLPVVDRIANERAAAMLRAAADWIWDDVPALASASAELRARADHLDPP